MKIQFIDLMNYNHDANNKFIEVFLNTAEEEGRARDLFCHILNSHAIWVSRILQQPPPVEVWQTHRLSDFKDIQKRNHQQVMDVIAAKKMTMSVHYKNSHGEVFDNYIQDIILHIANHSTYHRGQIAQLWRNEGIQPPATDYIIYKRQFNF